MVSGRWGGLRSLSLSRSRVSSLPGHSEHFVRDNITQRESERESPGDRALRAININQGCPAFESMSSVHYAKVVC